MKTIILDMYGVVIKAPEGDLIPYIQTRFPDKTDNDINYLWKELHMAEYLQKTFLRV